MKEIFSHIIKEHVWRDVLCGSGSTLHYTKPLRDTLPDFLRKHKITSMFDAPCGDYSWMSLVDLPVDYIGGDIVDFMIEDNRKKYPDVDFRVCDITKDDLPDVDVLFCRCCLFHFSDEDLRLAIKNIARSNIKYILTTSFEVGENKEIPTGGFRKLNLQASPYNFPAPIDKLNDYNDSDPVIHLCLWPKSVFEDFDK